MIHGEFFFLFSLLYSSIDIQAKVVFYCHSSLGLMAATETPAAWPKNTSYHAREEKISQVNRSLSMRLLTDLRIAARTFWVNEV